MDSGLLWREEVTKLHAEQYADVKLDHMLADAAAMHLVKAPKDIDVLLADNLFGDILSDEAAMLTGSIGMLPSAALGDRRAGLYEPVHGCRHRRQGPRQSDRRDPVARDGDALEPRSPPNRRPHLQRGQPGAGRRRAHRRPWRHAVDPPDGLRDPQTPLGRAKPSPPLLKRHTATARTYQEQRGARMTLLKIDYVEFASGDLAASKGFFARAFDWSFQDYGST